MIICIATAIATVWPETFCERKIESFKKSCCYFENKPEKNSKL